MKTFTCAVIALLVATAAAHEEVGKRVVRKMRTQANWDQASDHCARLGMQLLSPLTEEDNREAFRLLSEHNLSNMWIGATNRMRNEDEFVWQSVTGLPVTYTFFNEEPDNQGGNEHCLEFVISDKNRNGGWNDLECSKKRPYFCENIRANKQ